MFVSVVICTYRRADDLGRLLDCLTVQTYREFEVLVVDGSANDTTVRDRIEQLACHPGPHLNLRWIASPTGLTRQRNLGLRIFRGEIVCFLDDDVTFGADFLSRMVGILQSRDMDDVGGITGYDTLSRYSKTTFRRRLRNWLAAIQGLKPGDVDRFGRTVGFSDASEFSGYRRVHWLPGFCMAFRRAAVAGLSFDETLPTYGGEDIDFSIRVGHRWRLLLVGDLHLEHHRSPSHRVSDVERTFQCAFGVGRRIAKNQRGLSGCLIAAWTLMRELLIDAAAVVRYPSQRRLHLMRSNLLGIVKGYRSARQ